MAVPGEVGPDESIVYKMLGPLVPVHTLCTLLLGMRLYTHIRPVRNLGLDDAAAVLAMIATTTQIALFFAAIPYGVGRHNIYIPHDDQVRASRLLFISQLPWSWGVALGKISIALLLLRLKSGRGWKFFLYAMVAVQLASATAANIAQLVRCRPISAAWDFNTETSRCQSPRMIHISAYTNASIAVLTDVILAAIPLTFLRHIRRSPRERLVIAFLFGLGLAATAAASVKLTLIGSYGQTGDMLWDCVGLVTWSILEAQIGIIAACVPCLKSPLHSALRRVGWLSESSGHGRVGFAEAFRIGDSTLEDKDTTDASHHWR
ncbi:hypothetical protein B0T16DRAFT_463308 [Cercophora newfieldiana]|uniref:Rhodopsin domain-containing protein n=1 Tax=Cercophora newfieldiana TaxID=92897 RepID=A0AA39XSY0_9PEZI|nr:hypothetical protein B0T16DRAFT_463308 [Cercophora newfieldiana]